MLTFMDWPGVKSHPEGVVLRLRVTPQAARTELTGTRLDRLSVRVQAPPVEGKANAVLCRWLARTFGLKHSQVRLLRGERGREKDLLLEGATPENVQALLGALLSAAAARK
jgi:hypothetical protein